MKQHRIAARRARACCIGLLLAASPGAASAQVLPPNPPLPPTIGAGGGTPPVKADALPPYQPQLERLAERLGTLAFMRALCAEQDAGEWRKRMTSLIEAEGTTTVRRERLAGAFNRGFSGYQAIYRACTPAARLVIARFLAEGDRLARELEARFGGT